MEVVCASLRKLVEKVQPAFVYRVTKESQPTEKALEKHHMLTETLENAEYSLYEEGTDKFQRRCWDARVESRVSC